MTSKTVTPAATDHRTRAAKKLAKKIHAAADLALTGTADDVACALASAMTELLALSKAERGLR
ncbi:MAG: hypothetical protein QM765_47290 [Myxococcales bacterium]